MFGSKTKHMNFITFRVSTAEQHEELHADLIMPKKRLMEFTMTEAAFVALMSGMNRESVPVTLRHLMDGKTIEPCPEPVAILDLQEQKLNDITNSLRSAMTDITNKIGAMVDGKQSSGKTALKELQHQINVLNGQMASDMRYMETTTRERMEAEVQKATREVEAIVNSAATRLGHAALDKLPGFDGQPMRIGDVQQCAYCIVCDDKRMVNIGSQFLSPCPSCNPGGTR
jgi:paraquat-inducible protein B